MATFTSSACQANSPALYHVNRTITRTIKFVNSASYTAADVIQLMKVPAGAIIHDVRASYSLSAGVVTVNLGDGNDTSAYAADLALSGAGVVINSSKMTLRSLGRSYSAEDTIDMVVVSTSTPAANIEIWLSVTYTCQN